MEKRLPWEMPRVKAYADYANVFAILRAREDEKEVKHWTAQSIPFLYFSCDPIRKKYVLSYCKEFSEDVYQNNPLLETEKLYLPPEQLLCTVRRRLEEGYYAVIQADRFLLPLCQEYARQHFVHSMLIYGYSDETQCFLGADTIRDNQYQACRISFQDVWKAYCNGLKYGPGAGPVRFVKYLDNKVPVNTERLVLDLRSYLDAICNEPGAGAVNPYDCLAQELKDAKRIFPGSVCVWCEFMRFFVYKCKLMEEIGLMEQTQELRRIFEGLLCHTVKIQNLFLKYLYANGMDQKVCVALRDTMNQAHHLDIRAHEELLWLLNKKERCSYEKNS